MIVIFSIPCQPSNSDSFREAQPPERAAVRALHMCRKTKCAILLAVILGVTGCSSRVDLQKFTTVAPEYDERRFEQNVKEQAAFWTNDLENEMSMAFRRGYVPVATTSYRGEVGPAHDDVMSMVRNYGAAFAMVSASNTRSGTRAGMAPVYNPGQTATVTTNQYGSPTTTIHTGSSVGYQAVSQSYERSDFHVLYFRKSKPAILGILSRELSAEERQKSGRNGGVIIREVRDDSVAFRAGLLPLDLLFSVNDERVSGVTDLGTTLMRLAGSEVTLSGFRGGNDFSLKCVLEKPDYVTGTPVPFKPRRGAED